MNIEFYLVIDQNSFVWERSKDFENDGDHFQIGIEAITKDNILTYDEAIKFKDELDKDVASVNNITFKVVKLKF